MTSMIKNKAKLTPLVLKGTSGSDHIASGDGVGTDLLEGNAANDSSYIKRRTA